MNAPLLSVVSVVYNDAQGLKRTIDSVEPLLDMLDYWVIDGSSTDDVRRLCHALQDPRINLVSESDDGLYDAMNKGLKLASGDYILFLNAGDRFLPSFDPMRFLQSSTSTQRVILGYTVETYRDDHYIRPAIGKESDAFRAPPHQATAYPKAFYKSNVYDVSQPVSSDWQYTLDAIAEYGASFVCMFVAEFQYGGRSSQYGDLGLLQKRLKHGVSMRHKLRLLGKAVLWRLLGPARFYRAMAWRRRTRIREVQQVRELVANVGEVVAHFPPRGERPNRPHRGRR